MGYDYFMGEALKLAHAAQKLGEIPVGCVIVYEDKIISSGYNRCECDQNPLAHAEIIAIKNACEHLGYWRLCGASLYVTLEPCVMCAGAIINSRIDNVIFGLEDKKTGAFGGKLNLNEYELYHKPTVISGICKDEVLSLMGSFFRSLRTR